MPLSPDGPAFAEGTATKRRSLLFRVWSERGKKLHAAGDWLATIGEMFSDESVVKAELVRKYDRLAILPKCFRERAVHRMHRHGEVTQPHS